MHSLKIAYLEYLWCLRNMFKKSVLIEIILTIWLACHLVSKERSKCTFGCREFNQICSAPWEKRKVCARCAVCLSSFSFHLGIISDWFPMESCFYIPAELDCSLILHSQEILPRGTKVDSQITRGGCSCLGQVRPRENMKHIEFIKRQVSTPKVWYEIPLWK